MGCLWGLWPQGGLLHLRRSPPFHLRGSPMLHLQDRVRRRFCHQGQDRALFIPLCNSSSIHHLCRKFETFKSKLDVQRFLISEFAPRVDLHFGYSCFVPQFFEACGSYAMNVVWIGLCKCFRKLQHPIVFQSLKFIQ